MSTILDTQTLNTEIVLTERRATTEFIIREIHESIRNRSVRAEIELGPFTTETFPDGRTETRGSGQRGVTVWEGDAYDAVRDTWRNADLMAAVVAVLSS
jgi:hypothetical protein